MKKLNILTMLCILLLTGSCRQAAREETSGSPYIFIEKTSSYPEWFGKYSDSHIAKFLKIHSSVHPLADSVYVVEFHVMNAFAEFLPEGSDSMLVVFLSFTVKGQEQSINGDSILGEVFQIQEKDGSLTIVERKYLTPAEMMNEVSRDIADTDVIATDEPGEPVYWVNIFPEGGGPVDYFEKYYDTVYAYELFDILYYERMIPEVCTDTGFIREAYIEEDNILSVSGYGEKNYIDSLIIVFISYTLGSPQELDYEYETITRYELFVLEVYEGRPSLIASMNLGDMHESYSGTYSSVSRFDFEMFRVSGFASLIGIYYRSEEGSEYEGETFRELSLYALNVDELYQVLQLELGRSSYEADYQGPPEEQYSNTEVTEGQLYVSDETYDGFYKLEFRQTYKQLENREIISAGEETTYYVWTGSAYNPQRN